MISIDISIMTYMNQKQTIQNILLDFHTYKAVLLVLIKNTNEVNHSVSPFTPLKKS